MTKPTKVCKICGIVKTSTEYNGASAKCKPCQKTYNLSFETESTRFCYRCLETKDVSLFIRNNRNKGGYSNYCRRCNSINDFRRRYGIENIYEFLKDKTCEICEEPVSEGKGNFAIDHDHSCCPGDKTCLSCVRGILCQPCNTGLGSFRDNLKTLQNAINYIRKYNV